jgi:hypothetical protein
MPNIDFDQKPRGAADHGEYRLPGYKRGAGWFSDVRFWG